MKTRIIATAVLVLGLAFGAAANTPQPRMEKGGPDRMKQVRPGGPDHKDHHGHKAGHKKAKAYMHHGKGGNCHHHRDGNGHHQR